MSQKPAKNVWIPVTIALALVVGILLGMFAARTAPNLTTIIAEQSSSGASKISYTLSLINKKYIDPVNTDSIVELLMPELMATLDPHSFYLPAEDLTKANESLDGEFDGVGIVFNMTTDTIVVLNVIPQGPSHKAGVLNGDRIIKINDSLVAGRNIPQDNVVKMLRGKRGTKVNLEVERQGIEEMIPIEVTRGKIPIKSVDASFMLSGDVGFMRITAFAQYTYTEMVLSLASLQAQGMTKLILDIRGNSGGYLDQAIYMANEFLPKGKLIVYTEDRRGDQIKEYSDGKGNFQDIAMVILIDENSASSSEILAGALQDNDRATIVGRRSFGKGLVQQQIPFMDGSAIRLTTARYYTPTGRSIQKPYTLGDDASYGDELYNRYMHNELFSADSIKFDESMMFTTPGGRTVYGGGGIMPDIFIPLDTTDVTSYYMEVVGRNILYKYTMTYTDRHREAINAIESVAQLNALLDADASLLDDFIEYARRNGVAPVWSEIRKSEKLLTAMLRAYIGRNSPLEESGYYSNIYVVDPSIYEALKVLEEGRGL